MHLLCLNQLTGLFPKLPVDVCISLLERVLRNCGCVRGRKAFPCLQDQLTIAFLLRMAASKDNFRIYLAPYLEDIFEVTAEFIDQAKSHDYDFLLSFFLKMLSLNYATQDIIGLLSDFSNNGSKSMYQALYSEISKYLAEELSLATSLSACNFFSSVTEHIRIISSEQNALTDHHLLSSSLLMASSILHSQQLWVADSSRCEFAGLVEDWCHRVVETHLKRSEIGEDNFRLFVAVTIALVAISSANDDRPMQDGFFVLELMTGAICRPNIEIEEFYRSLPTVVVATKALVANLALVSQKGRLKPSLLDCCIWHPLASLLSDCILKSLGLLFSQISPPEHPYIPLDQNYYLKPLFSRLSNADVDPTFAIPVMRQLIFSSELSSRVNFDGTCNLYEPFIELIIIFVCITRQELFTIGWNLCHLKALLDQILELMKGQNITQGTGTIHIIKYVELLTTIFDCVSLITPSSSSVENLSLQMGSYIYPSLIDILSYGHCSPAIIDKVCILMGKLSARHDREFLSETLDVLCCNFSRYFMEIINHHTSPFTNVSTKGQYLLFLSHLGTGLMHMTTTLFYLGGGLNCEPPQVETPSNLRHPILLGMHKALVKLFIGLANAALSNALKESIQHDRPIEQCLRDDSAIGLLCLLPPIASTMNLLTPSKENISNSIVSQEDANMITDMGHLLSYDIFSLQSFWVHIALFEFSNLHYWEKVISRVGLTQLLHVNILQKSFEQIVVFTPPLVQFRGGSSLFYFESEVASNVVAKSILNCPNSGKLNGTYDWIDTCTRLDVVETMRKSTEWGHISRNVGMILTISAIFCIEKLRTQYFGDIRMIFYYLCDEGVATSSITVSLLTNFASSIAFPQWVGNFNRHHHFFLQRNPNRLDYVNTSSVIIFLFSRCLHSSHVVRDLALTLIEKLYQCNPELFWEYDALFTYLRCLDILGLLFESPINFSLPAYLSMEPWNIDIYLNILPTMQFLGANAISETGQRLLAFGYTALSEGILKLSELLYPILHEYILLSNHDTMQRSSKHDCRIGLAVANEFCSAGRPTCHINQSSQLVPLHQERSVAAALASQALDLSLKDSTLPDSTSIFLKSQYIGQALGVLDSVVQTFEPMCHSRVAYKGAFRSIFTSLVELFSNAKECDLSEKCEKLFLNGAALIRALIIQYDSSNQNLVKSRGLPELPEIYEFTLLYLNNVTIIIQQYYSHQLISTLIFVWKWLLGCSPRRLGPLVMSNMIAIFQQICTFNVGLFHRHNSLCQTPLTSKWDYRPSNANIFRPVDTPLIISPVALQKQSPYCGDCFPFEEWIQMLNKVFIISGTLYLTSLFSMLEILFHDVTLLSCDTSSMVSRFKLLTFAFRIIKASMVPSKAFNISIHRRRLLRERIFSVALDFLSTSNIFPSPNQAENVKEISVLRDFLTACFEDYTIWSVDYGEVSNQTTHESSFLVGSCMRGSGPAFAVKQLRSLMSFKSVVPSEPTVGPSMRSFGIQLSGARANSPERIAILWLIQALILRHINFLGVWVSSESRNIFSKDSTLVSMNKKFKSILKSTLNIFEDGLKVSWIFSPSLALSYFEKFSSKLSKSLSPLSCLLSLITTNPDSVRHEWRALKYVVNMTEPGNFVLFSKELCHWAPSSVSFILNLLNRAAVGYCPPKILNCELISHPIVLHYSVRSLRIQKHQHISTLQFFLPQFVQLLRRDLYGVIGEFIAELAVSSTLLCHQLIWLLQLESVDENSSSQRHSRHGYCNSLFGADPLPSLALDALEKTRNLLTVSQREYLDRECEFFNSITNISAKLREIKDKDRHPEVIQKSLIELGFHPNLYLPTDPYKAVTEVVIDSGVPMQSAAKCPFLLVFHTVPWGGPDSMSSHVSNLKSTSPRSTPLRTISIRNKKNFSISARKIGIGRMDSHSFNTPKIVDRGTHVQGQQSSASSSDGLDAGEILSTASSNFEVIEPTDFPATTTVQNASHLVKHEVILHEQNRSTTKFMKNWGNWKDFRLSRPHHRATAPFRATVLVGKHSPYPSHAATASSGKEACIFKVYDDCRQDALTIQVVKMLKEAFEEINLPLYLVPYSVIPNRTGSDHAQGGILQVVPNVKSRDQIGKEGAKTLKQHFLNQFGSEFSSSYKQAQLEFARSAAGYAIVCYLLSVKDRHNGNILIDNEGHLIHIDFGFLLGISPGGNLGFENAAFKLSKEMIEVLGGNKHAEPFRCFVDWAVQGFLVAREIAMEILITVTSLMDSGLPCFRYKENNLDLLRERFFLQDSDSDAVAKLRKLIDDAANKWTTIAYDGIQKLQNNIYSDSWR